MTIRDRIIQYLENHPEGIDDDSLAERLQLSHRQQANARCRELERDGLIIRRRVGGKIQNFWVVNQGEALIPPQPGLSQASNEGKATELWFWEGNVQARVVEHLVANGYLIRSVADTASRQRGKDVMAEKDGLAFWVTVKGYPKGTDKTRPSTQAGHWFKQAVFDIIEYRGENEKAELVLALPDFPRYRTLSERIIWFQEVSGFVFFWVQKNGDVVID